MNTCETCKFCILWANGEGADCNWKPPPMLRPPFFHASIMFVERTDGCSL